MKEEWKQIKDYESYEVSNLGHFRRKVSHNLYKTVRGGHRLDGAIVIGLMKNGVRRRVPAHALVAEYFLPNPRNCWTVRHIDGNIKNNQVSNLKWCKQGHEF